jgi:hypothetical protein
MASATWTCNKDARIASSNLGAGASNFNPFGAYSGYQYRTLLGFSGSMAGWVTITGATLHYRMSTQYYVAFGSSPTGLFQRITGAWSEGSSSGMSTSNAVTYPGPAVTDTNRVSNNFPTSEGAWATTDITAMMRDVLAGGVFNGIRIIGWNGSAESGSASDVGEIYSREGGSAPYITFSYTTNTAPGAPTVASSGVTSGLSGSQTPPLAFTLTDPDADVLTQYRWQIDNNSDFSSPAQDLTVSGSFASGSVQTVTPAALTRGTTYYVRAQAYDGQVWGAWSTTFSFKVASAPVVTITEPSATGRLAKLTYTPGAGWVSPRLVTNWTFSCPDGGTQKTYRVELLNDPGSSTVNDSGTVTDTAARTRTVPFDLTESSYYQVRITCVCSHGVTTVAGPYRVRARWGVVTHRFDMTVAVGSLSLGILDVTDETNGGSGHVYVEYNTTTTTAAPASYVGSIGAAGLNRYFWYRAWLLAWGASPAVSPTLNELKINYTTTVFTIVPDQWTRQDAANSFGDSSSFVYGTQSLKMLGKGSAHNVYQQVPVVPGTDYILSGRIAAQGAAAASLILATAGTGGGVVGTPLVNNTLFTDPGSRVQTPVWNSGSATSIFIECRVSGPAGTAAWFDAIKLEASTVVTPWSPGYIAPAVVLDAGGLQIDGAAGGIFRLRGSGGGLRDLVELGVDGLKFGGDVNVFSPAAGLLQVPSTSLRVGDQTTGTGVDVNLNGTLEISGSTNAFIDLKTNPAHDFDARIIFGAAAVPANGLGILAPAAGFGVNAVPFVHAGLQRFGGAAFPASPATGDLFYHTGYHMWFYYSGSAWLDIVSLTTAPPQLVQSGTVSIVCTAAISATATVTFPIPFSSVPVVVASQSVGSNATFAVTSTATATQVPIVLESRSGAAITATHGVSWVAVGNR